MIDLQNKDNDFQKSFKSFKVFKMVFKILLNILRLLEDLGECDEWKVNARQAK